MIIIIVCACAIRGKKKKKMMMIAVKNITAAVGFSVRSPVIFVSNNNYFLKNEGNNYDLKKAQQMSTRAGCPVRISHSNNNNNIIVVIKTDCQGPDLGIRTREKTMEIKKKHME